MKLNTRHENSVPNDSSINEIFYPNIYLQFLKLAVNVMAGIAFLQHLHQVREESHDLVRVSRKTLQLSQEVDTLREENAQHEMRLQLYMSDVDGMEEELGLRYQNSVRMQKEIDLLQNINEALDEDLFLLEYTSALNLFISPSIFVPHLMAGFADSENGGW